MLDSVYGHSAICTDRKRRSPLPSSLQDIHGYLRQPCCTLPRSPSGCSPSLQDATACKSLTGLFSLICRIPAGTSRSSPGRPHAARRATRRLHSELQEPFPVCFAGFPQEPPPGLQSFRTQPIPPGLDCIQKSERPLLNSCRISARVFSNFAGRPPAAHPWRTRLHCDFKEAFRHSWAGYPPERPAALPDVPTQLVEPRGGCTLSCKSPFPSALQDICRNLRQPYGTLPRSPSYQDKAAH